MKNRLRDLQKALSQPPELHLADEILAAIVTSEAAGEDVEHVYAEQLRHIENCVVCAEAYEQLAELMFTAVHEMMAAASGVSPTAVYTQLLAHQLSILPAKLEALVAALPLWFTHPPTNEAELAPIARYAALSPGESSAIIQVISRRLTSLALYLKSLAESSWGHLLDVTTGASAAGSWLQLQAAPQPVVATLSSQQIGDEWLVLQRPFPPHWLLTVRAYRLSPLACRLTVRADQPGLTEAGGQMVQISYGGQVETAVTDKIGIATFASIPIAALTQLEITLVE